MIVIFVFRFIRRLFYKKVERDLLSKLEKLLCITPRNVTLYKVAFQYKSTNKENYSNERLEFLGDAALSLIIGHYLFKKYPNKDEGFLTDVRSRLVNRATMGLLASKMGIQHLLKHDNAFGRSRHTCGNTLEALIGAIYLDIGYEKCYKTVINMFMNYSDFEYIINTEKNFKSLAFEWANKNQREIEIKVIEKFEADDKIFFRAQISIDSVSVCVGEARGKKEAEQNAARKFVDLLQNDELGEFSELLAKNTIIHQVDSETLHANDETPKSDTI